MSEQNGNPFGNVSGFFVTKLPNISAFFRFPEPENSCCIG
tara:strand:+ start:995 stop:1114 length:120 start_codon:yes stop_codon:yes gene_type:complete